MNAAMTPKEIINTQILIFSLLLEGGDGGKVRADALIRKLDARARRDLRATLQICDHLLDDIHFEELREKRRRS